MRGLATPDSTPDCLVDRSRIGDPADFWIGYSVRLLAQAEPRASARANANHNPTGDAPSGSDRTSYPLVTRFDTSTGRFHIDPPIQAVGSAADGDSTGDPGLAFELSSGQDAPIIAIRFLMGLRLDEPIGPILVRLGTTRATNALLERKGAKVGLVTTKGFGDVLKIGHQERPELFKLHIRKRQELTARVVEIDERLSADGEILRAVQEDRVLQQLRELRREGVESVALCLLHAHVNPRHEEIVARIAEKVGFENVSVSSRVARMEGFVSRGDTTVVDAYLSGVLREYVTSLRRAMPDARLQLMTSAGGLVDALRVSAKDTILSGPAGGVVGCVHVARKAGFDQGIGFDMGGTSTDVSRFDPPPGGFEYRHETVQAGVRVKTPMLAIETVAAGGGSICRFDGQKLTVGPDSAGADPGPACYGRGGPLTVTDMNVFLGRVVPDYFPFRLDRNIVKRRLLRLRDHVNKESCSSLSSVELAEGFIRIANADMASAIQRISLAKGYDVRDYVLVTFGGAGAQHACALAQMLGISRVLCSPLAGVLSALGIGVADLKRLEQQSVRRVLDEDAASAVEPLFESMTRSLERALGEDGVEAAYWMKPVRTMDLCYRDQGTTITVPAGPFGQVRGNFERMHRQLYGYVHTDRNIEIRVLRVELSGGSPSPVLEAVLEAGAAAPQVRTTEMVVHGRRRSVPMYMRDELQSGQKVTGPAIVIEATSTIVVDEGWQATLRASGDLILTASKSAKERETVSTKADPIQIELFHRRFAATAERMGTVLRRTALSTNVKERLDYSCAIFTPEGDLVANAPHIPVHLGAMAECVKALMEDVGSFEPGDVYVTNDPYRGGSHLNDVTVITPVHQAHRPEAGAPRPKGAARFEPRSTDSGVLFFVASRAHHAEIGGTTPGSMPPDSTCLAQEGVVIRAIRWMRNGQPQHDPLRALLTEAPFPSRSPDENLADIAAQVAANQTGVQELQAMIARYGLDVVHSYMRHIQAASEAQMRAAIARLPSGTHRFEDRMDDGTPIRLAVTIDGDHARFDFTGTGAVVSGNLNANRAIVSSALLYCLRCLIDEDVPLNGGMMAPIELILPECFLNPPGNADPSRCPAVAGGNVETSQRVVDTVLGALGAVAASQGTMNNLSIGNDRFGYYETICGGAGAGPEFDGADAVHTHMTNTRLTDPEVLESRYPLRLVRFAIRRGSGGAGRYRGGCGVVREIEFLEPLEVSILTQRRLTRPYGLEGGSSGAAGRNVLRRAGTSEEEVLGPAAIVHVGPGDRLIIETPGGGGYGRP